mgnify:FL=1
MKYGFIKRHRQEFCIKMMCSLMKVSRSGYYDWVKFKPSKRDIANLVLDKAIKSLFTGHKMRYGAPRITRALNDSGINCSRGRVARRMRVMGLKSVASKKFKVTTDSQHSKPIYSNVLNRDFSTTATNQKWCSDISYIRTDEGWLYLAVIIDLHSRAIIGWSMNSTMNQDLVCNALLMALFRRGLPAAVIIHSDRGSQYCSHKYRKLLEKHKLIGSMSRRGNCWDNAIAESFFHTLKVELVHQCRYKTREIAKQSIFQYMEGYYNRKRVSDPLTPWLTGADA